MATDPLTQSALGLDSFTNQVTEFQNAIDAVSDPAKKAALQANLTAFKAAFEAVSAATAYQMVQDIELRGYDLTKEQELAIKYEKEIMDVRAREDLTAQDKVKIINRLIAAREREVEAMEREQELLNLQGAQNTLQEILSTFEKTIEGINDLITSLYDQVQDLLFGEFNLDPYLQKFELASETYGTLLEAAFDPDATEDDIKQLQEFVNTYLGTARDLYKSSSTFQQIFSNVLSDLSMLGVQAGFNMPQTAVSGATSEIQDFIDATEDLSEELSETLNDLIFDLNSLGLAFANQKLDIIQDELGIPLKITNDEIVVDLSGVSVPLELTDSNFTLDTTKLNLAASFTVEALGFKNYEETVTFTPTISGFEDYSETATFTATITGWDSYTGTATFTSNITGFTDYSKTASFSALLTGWTDYSASSTLDVTLKDWVDYSVGSSLIATFSGWQDYSKSSTLSASFSGWQNYSKSSTLSTSFSGWQNYSNSATFTGSYGSSQGWKSYSATATFDPSPFVSEFENARNMIQSTIDSFSLNFSLLETLSVGGAYVSEAKITSKENAYYAGPGSGTTYSEAQKTSYDDEPVPSIQDLAATLKTLSPEATGYDYGIYYVIKSTEYDANTYTYRDKTLPRLALFSEKSDAEAAYNYIAGISSDTLDFQNLTKLGFQQGGLVPGPMDIIPAMLSPGEYIMSRGAVDSLGIGTLNSLNAGDFSALRQTGDPEVRRLLRELIVAVQTSDTEVNVYTDTKGETKAAINEFRTELRERSRRQGEKYVNVRYV
jgi:hypothetical protein